MATHLRELFMRELGELRYEPVQKRIRAALGDRTVVDSTRAMIVWEPRRVVPTYAVPAEDVAAELVEQPPAPAADAASPAARPVLPPSVPFSVHSTDGEPLTLRGPAGDLEDAAFRPSDPALDGYVILDFHAFDAWYEEDELNLAHPRDPFHRVDIVRSSRQVRVEHRGTVVAESSDARMLFEPPMPVRYYLPRADVRMDLLRPSEKKTFCAYKGQASYFSLEGEDDVAWSYPEPLSDAAEITGRIAFFNDRVDLAVEGAAVEEPAAHPRKAPAGR